MNATSERALPLLFLLLAGCRESPPAVGVLMSTGIEAAAQAAVAEEGPGAIRLEVGSSPTAADAALDGAERMVERGVVAVVGHSNSAASLTASQVYNRAGIVQIAPTTTATVYERAGPYSFRLVPSDRQQAQLLARAALQLGRGAPVAVLYENDAYGYGLYRDLGRAADSLGLRFTGAGAFLANEEPRVLRALLAAVLRPRPRVVLWLGRATPLDSLMASLRAADVLVIGPDALDNAAVHRNLRGNFDGLVFVRLLDARVQARAVAQLADRVEGVDIGAEALLTYDAVGVIRAAVGAGARQGSEIRGYLLSLGRERPPYRGLTGPIQFDENRTLQRPWRLARVTGQGVTDVSEVQ